MLRQLRELSQQFFPSENEGVIRAPCGNIRYIRDPWGYPRVRVNDLDEGAFARGYLHALDRFVQVQLSLLLAQGRGMEFFGPEPLFRLIDRAMRALNVMGDLHRQTAKLTPKAARMLQAYCDGFNAASKRRRLPRILKSLGIVPVDLTPELVVLLYRFTAFFGLTSNHQLAEGTVLQLAGKGAPKELFQIILGNYADNFEPSKFLNLSLEPDELFFFFPLGGGSNAIAVSPELSASGSPLLLSEFHLEVGKLPPAFYAIATEFPDGNYYYGFGIPGLPWLSSGRTKNIAWTYTFAHGDNIDIMVEHCRNEHYLTSDGRYYPARRRVERVSVRGQKEPVIWTFYDSPFGTILGDASKEGLYPTVRWSGLRDSYSDINAVREMMEAETAEEFAELQRGVKTLSLAAICADKLGNISYIHTGLIDEKPEGYSGAYPLFGPELPPEVRTPSPRSEESRLYFKNPPEGFIISANEWRSTPTGSDWITLSEPDYRYRFLSERLRQIKGEGKKLSPRDLIKITYSAQDLCARELLAVWGKFLPEEQDRAKRLIHWSQNQPDSPTRESRANLQLFYALYRRVVIKLLERHIDKRWAINFVEQFGLLLLFQYHIDRVLRLERPELLSEGELRGLVSTAWPEALEDVDVRGYPEFPIEVEFKHFILGELFSSFVERRVKTPGSPNSPFQTRSFVFFDMKMWAGPLFHFGADLSEDGFYYNVCGGAREWPLSEQLSAPLDDWLSGDSKNFFARRESGHSSEDI